MLSVDLPPDPGLTGMLQGSEPDTKSHGSHLRRVLRRIWAPECPLCSCTFCLPHAPSSWPAEDSQPPTLPSHLRSFLLRAFWVEPLLPSYSKGQGFPPLLPRLSSQHLCWILVSLPGAAPSCFLGRVWSPHFRPASSFRRITVLREGGGRDGACGGEPGDGGLLSLAPYPNRAWCPASSGPKAHLFCALVTYESSPSLGPQPVPDTPWGPPVKLLALRGSCSAGPSALGQASGVARTTSPLPLPHLHAHIMELPGARAPRQAGLTLATVFGRAL